MGTTKHLANPLKDPWKRGPLHGENLDGTTELVRQNILPRNIPGQQGDRMTLGPKHYLSGHTTQDMRHCAALIPELRDNCGTVAHQDDTLTRQLGQNAARARTMAFISNKLMCREISSLDHTPEAVRSKRWAPQHDRDASVCSNRDGGGNWRGTPNIHLSSWSHQRTASTHSGDRGI